MGKKQDAYQARKLAAGKCRRCGQRDRLERLTGRLSPYCQDCGDKASAEALRRYHRRKGIAGAGATATAPAGSPVTVITGDPDDPEMVRRLHLAMRRCANCQSELTHARLLAGVEMCESCQPEIC